MSANTRRKLRIIHFNDVYEIEHRDDAHPGAAKFAAAVKQRTPGLDSNSNSI